MYFGLLNKKKRPLTRRPFYNSTLKSDNIQCSQEDSQISDYRSVSIFFLDILLC
jgi:hypothetical protein